MNTVNLIGRLTAEPELQKTKNGISVCNVYLAVKGIRKEDIDFIPVQVWKANAENLCKYMHKGDKIGVVGRLKQTSYIDSNNYTRHAIEVIAHEVHYCETTRKVSDDDRIFDEKHRTQDDWKKINDDMVNVEDAPF